MFLPISCTSPLTVAINTRLDFSFSEAGGGFFNFSSSIYGSKYATAFFITRADFTTCGRNIFPSPKRSPTTFIPVIKCPSITCNGFSEAKRASSTSSRIYASIPFTRARVIRSCKGSSRQERSTVFSLAVPFTLSAKSRRRSVASSRRSRITSSTCSKRSFGISS